MSAPEPIDMTLAQLALVLAVLTTLYGADVLQRRMYADYKDTLLFFYADWCGHCVAFKKEWARFQTTAARDLPGLKTLALESSSGNAAGNLFNVSSYPTLVYVDSAGRRHDYGGHRTSEGLAAFVSGLR